MRWRVRAGYPVGLAYLLLAAPTRQSILYGAIVAAFGLIVRGAASGHLRKDRQLATTGPYACTRNPLYLGSAFLAAGFIIAGHSWVASILVAVYFGAFYYAVIKNEEADLRARFGATFEDWAKRVPLFFPRAPSPTAADTASTDKNFSWAQYAKNREYKALIGTIAGVGLLFLRMWVHARWGY